MPRVANDPDSANVPPGEEGTAYLIIVDRGFLIVECRSDFDSNLNNQESTITRSCTPPEFLASSFHRGTCRQEHRVPATRLRVLRSQPMRAFGPRSMPGRPWFA